MAWSPYSLQGVPMCVKSDEVARTARTASPLAASAAVVKVNDEKDLPTSPTLLSLATALGSGDSISQPELIGDRLAPLVAFNSRRHYRKCHHVRRNADDVSNTLLSIFARFLCVHNLGRCCGINQD